MPQLPNGAFGPIPGSVVLDGSGNGQLTFQPNGKNARITNLFGKVSTVTNQAVVNVYLGQVADSNRVFNNNSGSTGFSANGFIDVMDGQTLYVVWSGGDAGATATATFSGTTVPFGEAGFGGGFHMEANDPIAAGDGSLIFPALKSPNYEAGVIGWKIDRNGDAEFNLVTVRGTLQVDGINDSSIIVWAFSGQPQILLTPEQTIPGWQILPAELVAVTSVGSEVATLSISGPQMLAGLATVTPQLNLSEATDASSAFKSQATLQADEIEITAADQNLRLESTSANVQLLAASGFNIRVNRTITDTTYGMDIPRRQRGTNSTATGGAGAVSSGTILFPVAYPLGVIPDVFVNVTNTAGGPNQWRGNAQSITNTGFVILYTGPASSFNVTSYWNAFV
jgi:hypothetical protein